MFIRKKEKRFKKRIAVGGMIRGCGVSFVCQALAYGLLAENRGPVNVAELGIPHFYTAFELDSRPLGGPFESFSEVMRSMRAVSSVRNELFGINWLARRPREKALDAAETIRAVNSMPEGSTLFDCSGMDEKLLREVMASCELSIMVVDPRPSRLYAAYDMLGSFRLERPDGMLLVNAFNPGVHRAELSAFLGTDSWEQLPALPLEYFCRAEYSCSPLPEQKKAARMLEQPVKAIIDRF